MGVFSPPGHHFCKFLLGFWFDSLTVYLVALFIPLFSFSFFCLKSIAGIQNMKR